MFPLLVFVLFPYNIILFIVLISVKTVVLICLSWAWRSWKYNYVVCHFADVGVMILAILNAVRSLSNYEVMSK